MTASVGELRPCAHPRAWHEHGTRAAYVRDRCRCLPCREANARYEHTRSIRAYTAGAASVPSIGTLRRLRALACLGWTTRQLAADLGVTKSALTNLRTATRVDRANAARVAALYDRLSFAPGPSRRTRAYAERQGWAPPLAWDDDLIDDPASRPLKSVRGRVVDEVAVQRAMDGDRKVARRLHPSERREAVLRLVRLGLNDQQIERRTGISARTVIRHRQASQADDVPA